jgi:1-acyl-sn-glycerol-3-phosphate acyltransferase
LSQIISRFIRNLKGVLVFSAVAINTVVSSLPLMILALCKFLVPVPGFGRVMSRWIMTIGEFWISVNSRILEMVNKTRWDVRGLDELKRDSWYLVMSNHQTWVDIIAVQTVLNRRIPFLKFFIKQELIWFPVLGIVWWAMDMPFMKRYSKSYLAKYPEKKGKDLEITRKACQKFRDTPTAVMNFIEGTRFTPEKKIKRDSPYQYLLPPRAGGIALALSSMGDMFDAILDVTIVYPGSPPNFWALFCGEVDHAIVHIEQRPVDDWMINGDYGNDRDYRRRFHQWLTTVWQEKDRRIERMRAEIAAAG